MLARLYFPFNLLPRFILTLFPDAIIKITRTLTLLFISLHHNADATKRLELEALWAEVLPV